MRSSSCRVECPATCGYIVSINSLSRSKAAGQWVGPDARRVNYWMVDAITFRPVTSENWHDFEKLFESRGGPKSCWCTVWRTVEASPTAERPATAKKREMKRRISSAVPVGLLGYLHSEPVAWCSIAPRDTYRASMSDVMPDDEKQNIWSIVCFFVSRPFRGQGIFQKMISAAEEHAARNGATLLEGYPVDPESPSYRFGGYVPAFEQAGYARVGQKGARRHIVRKMLRTRRAID
jgi:GNAT superfamily N-acetyltransferase